MSKIDAPNKLPSVDRLLRDKEIEALSERFGESVVTQSVRRALQTARDQLLSGGCLQVSELVELTQVELKTLTRPPLCRVFNLTGTVLHTNLGRALLPTCAMDAVVEAAQYPSNLEFDLAAGKRGDRHGHAESLFKELTGAEAGLVVNNNAAAVLLLLNSLALRKEVIVSRGELIEIGGAFRMPDIMSRAGCKLVEVGTTNRTHANDYGNAIGSKTALLMKVHTSNYEIKGFTKQVSEKTLAGMAREKSLPLVTDLGSGTLIDLQPYGLPHEPTVAEALDAGADLVTFSGDKLLGGPQAGIIVGRSDLIQKIKKNPMTRALRPDKLTLAALLAVLRLYLNPGSLSKELPTLRLLSREPHEIKRMANRLVPVVQNMCKDYCVRVVNARSQVGSGAIPVDHLDSFALEFTRPELKRPGSALSKISRAFRALEIPVIGRISDDAFILDIRCLEDEDGFLENLKDLDLS